MKLTTVIFSAISLLLAQPVAGLGDPAAYPIPPMAAPPTKAPAATPAATLSDGGP